MSFAADISSFQTNAQSCVARAHDGDVRAEVLSAACAHHLACALRLSVAGDVLKGPFVLLCAWPFPRQFQQFPPGIPHTNQAPHLRAFQAALG